MALLLPFGFSLRGVIEFAAGTRLIDPTAFSLFVVLAVVGATLTVALAGQRRRTIHDLLFGTCVVGDAEPAGARLLAHREVVPFNVFLLGAFTINALIRAADSIRW